MENEKNTQLLLLDNGTLAYILGNGDYRFANLRFEEARAILDMNGGEDVAICFQDADLESVIYDYLGIEKKDFRYETPTEMKVGQDAIAFKLYITPSGTQPIILGNGGQEAKKIKNVYIYCQHIVRLK